MKLITNEAWNEDLVLVITESNSLKMLTVDVRYQNEFMKS
jgi:hypothetical protein